MTGMRRAEGAPRFKERQRRSKRIVHPVAQRDLGREDDRPTIALFMLHRFHRQFIPDEIVTAPKSPPPRYHLSEQVQQSLQLRLINRLVTGFLQNAQGRFIHTNMLGFGLAPVKRQIPRRIAMYDRQGNAKIWSSERCHHKPDSETSGRLESRLASVVMCLSNVIEPRQTFLASTLFLSAPV